MKADIGDWVADCGIPGIFSATLDRVPRGKQLLKVLQRGGNYDADTHLLIEQDQVSHRSSAVLGSRLNVQYDD